MEQATPWTALRIANGRLDTWRVPIHALQRRGGAGVPTACLWVSLGLPPDGVLRFGIAVAAGPREHRRLDLEFEQVLLLTRRLHGGVRARAFAGELLC